LPIQGRPQIALTGVGRGAVRCALLVLTGAGRAELERASAVSAMLGDACLLVAVDGGLRTCRAARRRPDVYVGDRDSIRTVPTGLPAVVFPREKDFSDFYGALGEMRRRRVQVLVVAGLLGGRLDHEWSNVLEASRATSWFAAVVAPTERGLVVLTRRGCRAVTVPDRIVSLFSPCGRSVVTLRGTRWTLRRRALAPGSLGLSNLTGTGLHLTVHKGSVALVFPPWTPPGAARGGRT
jgi:thiamine pyrophosphokinase